MSEREQLSASTADVPHDVRSVQLRPLFRLQLEVSAVQKVGTPSAGLVVGVVSGGRFEGLRLSGRVLQGGSDWQRVLPDGSLRLDCRIVLETIEGALIAMTYRGVRAGSPEVLARLAAGTAVGVDMTYGLTQLSKQARPSTRSSTEWWL
jgi:hypothetical protein